MQKEINCLLFKSLAFPKSYNLYCDSDNIRWLIGYLEQCFSNRVLRCNIFLHNIMLFHGADGPAKDSDVKVGGWEPSWEWGAEDTHVNMGDEDSDMKGGAEDMKEWDTEDSDVKGGGGLRNLMWKAGKIEDFDVNGWLMMWWRWPWDLAFF